MQGYVCRWADVDVKRCSDCGVTKTLDEFSTAGRSSLGLQRWASRCKSCNVQHSRRWRAVNGDRHRAYQRAYVAADPSRGSKWREENPGKVKQLQRKRVLAQYGLTPETYDALFVSQGNVCAVCGVDKPSGHGWHIDHDHVTGAVRGILCSRCNPVFTQHLEKHWESFAEYRQKHCQIHPKGV